MLPRLDDRCHRTNDVIMRILFANHTGTCSGAEIAMVRLLESLRQGHDVAVACPSDSPLAETFAGASVKQFSIPAIDMSLRLHPVWTVRGAGQLGAAGLALRSTANRWHADVVHANSLRTGLAAAAAARLGCPPVIVQSHEHLPASRPGRAVRAAIAGTASEVVGVTERTVRSFNEGLDRPVAQRVYISIDHRRFDPARVSPAPLREDLGLAPDTPLLGQVAQITPWKGQDTAVRILADLRGRGMDAHLVIVGQIAFDGKAVRYDNHDYLDSLHRLVDELGVGGAVHFMGHRSDIPAVMRALDLTLLPSRDEPFGTVVAESMAMGTPALVGTDGGPSEYIVDGVSGRVLPPADMSCGRGPPRTCWRTVSRWRGWRAGLATPSPDSTTRPTRARCSRSTSAPCGGAHGRTEWGAGRGAAAGRPRAVAARRQRRGGPGGDGRPLRAANGARTHHRSRRRRRRVPRVMPQGRPGCPRRPGGRWPR